MAVPTGNFGGPADSGAVTPSGTGCGREGGCGEGRLGAAASPALTGGGMMGVGAAVMREGAPG